MSKYKMQHYFVDDNNKKVFAGDDVIINGAVGNVESITAFGVKIHYSDDSDIYCRCDRIESLEKVVQVNDSDLPVEDDTYQVSDLYRLKNMDYLNVQVQKKTIQEIKDNEGNITEHKDNWSTISYHPNLPKAFQSLVDREINSVPLHDLGKVVKKIEELKNFRGQYE